jgi:hypothetical protein
MAQQLTAPQQSYCEHMSQGMSQSDAYKMAYPGSAPATIYSQSSRMAKLPHIMQEIERLREPVVQQQAWDRARLVRELWELSQAARLKHQYGSAVRSLELIGKACGLLIDRQEITASVRTEAIVSLSTEQLLSLARQAQLAEIESGTHALQAAGENGQAAAASIPTPGG